MYFTSGKHLDSFKNNFITTAYSIRLRQFHIALTMVHYYTRIFFMARQPHWDSASSLLRFQDHTQKQHTRYDSSGRVIGPACRPLPDNTQLLRQTDIHVPGEIRTCVPSKRTAADLRLRLRGHWDRHYARIEKAKTIPLQAWTGPKGSRRLRLPDFMTIGT